MLTERQANLIILTAQIKVGRGNEIKDALSLANACALAEFYGQRQGLLSAEYFKGVVEAFSAKAVASLRKREKV